MATEANLNPEDDKDDKKNLSVGGPGDAQSSGPSGSMPVAPTRPATPSGTPNIQSYLKANQGAGQQLAQGITGNVQKQANEFGQQVQNSSNKLNAQANPLQQNLGAGGQNLIKTSFQNPQDILSKQDQLNQFQKLRDQGYKGDLSNLQNQGQIAQNQLQNQLGTFNQAAQNAGTESGRFQLLRNTLGQPSYSQGQQKLDQLFLQAQPGAGKQLNQNLQGINKQVGNQLQGAASNFQNTLNGLNTQSAQNASDIQNILKTGNYGTNDLGEGFNDIGTAVQQHKNELIDLKNQLPAYQQALKSNMINQAQLNQLGLGNMGGQSLYGVDASQFINQTPIDQIQDPTMAQSATPEQLARYRALNQLAGSGAEADIFGNAQQVGGYDPFQYNQSGLQTAIGNAKQKAENQVTQYAQDLYNQIPGARSASGSSFAGSADPGAAWRGDLKYQLQNVIDNPNHMTASQQAQALRDVIAKGGAPVGYSLNEMKNNWGNASQNAYNYLDQLNALQNQRLGTGGTQNPGSPDLPTTPNGAIDWTKIKAPQGK